MAFFEDNTPRVFGVAYDAIDMADLIPQERVRDIVKQAQEKESSDDTIEAMALLVDAFDDLFRGKPWSDTEGAYTFGPRIRRSLREADIHRVLEHGRGKSAIPTAKAGDLAGQIATITEVVIALQGAMQVLASGIDYPQYDRFQVLTPHVAYMMSGDRRVAHHQDYAPSKEDFEYCKRFVISSALRLVEVEGHRSAPPWLA
jgi:hypothetical protein